MGCGIRLECASTRLALDALAEFPDSVSISINASPSTIVSGQLADVLLGHPMNRVIIELTEHSHIIDYTPFLDAMAPFRAAGCRLAVDDAGAGYASLRHIIYLRPDIIKLDVALTKSLDTDPARRSLITALVLFAQETDCVIIAEGIETRAEFEALQYLGVPMGQGHFLGHPCDVRTARRLIFGGAATLHAFDPAASLSVS